MNRVACLGECMIELVEHGNGTLTRGFGGDTLNTAVYLARLRVPTEYVTALGTDPFSDEMISGWHSEGIGINAILRLAGHPCRPRRLRPHVRPLGFGVGQR